MSDRVPRPPREGQDPSRVRHLRLISPAAPKAPRTKAPVPYPFTEEENNRLRAALKNARPLFGTWACLASAMYLATDTVRGAAYGQFRVSPLLAVRLAKALGVPVDALTRPGLRVVPFPSICPTCGRGPDGAP